MAHPLIDKLRQELHTVIVGQETLIDRLLTCLLCEGHILLEGVPGLAKTKTIRSLTECISLAWSRVQFTPDLLPSDLTGTEVFHPQQSSFTKRKGPIFTNFLLADEINRAPAKVQSALLQAMEERQVTIGDETFPLPDPFVVLATQNPIEQDGTYPLPEAQLDRFLMKVIVDYPSYDEEVQIVSRMTGQSTVGSCKSIMTRGELLALREEVKRIHVDPRIDRYVVRLVQDSRYGDRFGMKGLVEWGASPRAAIALKVCARAKAFIEGRAYTTPEDVKDIAPDVLRHRIVLNVEAEIEKISPDYAVKELLRATAIP